VAARVAAPVRPRADRSPFAHGPPTNSDPNDVQVTGDQATVTLRSGKTLGLVKSDDGWLIDRP
jgi:hypothetical protein